MYEDNRIKFEHSPNSTRFVNTCAKRSDSGKYTIRLSNPEGTDSASCRVLVVGKYLNFQMFSECKYSPSDTFVTSRQTWASSRTFGCI